MHIRYIAPFAQRTGYAQAAHDYMLALHRAGVSMEIVPITSCNTDDLEERYHELIPLAAERSGKEPTHTIIHTVPIHAWRFVEGLPGKTKKVALTTWETSYAPRSICDTLEEFFDLVIVPSEFCARALGGAWVVPHCFDPKHWPVKTSPTQGDRAFRFYSILGWSERKNPIGLLKAYLSVFNSGHNVILRIKASGYVEDDIKALITSFGIPIKYLPALEIITDYFDHDEMARFHHENDVFVTAARGEGWNLPAFEATLCGNPALVPGFGGETEFGARRYGFSLTPAVVPPSLGSAMEVGGMKIQTVNQIQPSGITGRQLWAEPDLKELSETMHAARHGFVPPNRESLEQKFSYEAVSKRFIEVLESC